MAIFFDAAVEPDALTAFVRNVPIPDSLSLLAEAGSDSVQRNTVDFAEITKTNRTARFRSYDGRIHVSERDTSARASGQAAAAVLVAEHGRVRASAARVRPHRRHPNRRRWPARSTTTPSSSPARC
jgi:hypothetical protein